MTAIDTETPTGPIAVEKRWAASLRKLIHRIISLLGWGLADQAVSSLTNFAVSIYIARVLGAVQFGAFSLAYVTYSFALNASRGISTDPLLVRFSGSEPSVWRRAVAGCTGTATATGLVGGGCMFVVAAVLRGTVGSAFFALGLTLPFLLLQDSWRYSFFAHRRGSQAFLNDLAWAVTLVPALVLLRTTHHDDVFWLVFAWGATAGVGAAIGPLQARVLPSFSAVRRWLSDHRDLGPRYLLEGVSANASTQLHGYGVGLMLGLAAVGYIQAANTLMGPFMVAWFGIGLVILPEAVGLLRRSREHLMRFCVLVSGGLAVLAIAWGVILLVALPRGLGQFALGSLWRPTYPLILPLTISLALGCASTGASTGLHALGAARRSLRAMAFASIVVIITSLSGTAIGGAVGTMWGTVVGAAVSLGMFWWQFHLGLREFDGLPRQAVATATDAPAG